MKQGSAEALKKILLSSSFARCGRRAEAAKVIVRPPTPPQTVQTLAERE